MCAVRRDKWVHLKVAESERDAWQSQAADAGLTLADLMRQKMGGAAEVNRDPPRRRRLTKAADPALLAILGRLNGNMNSLAKWASTYKSKAEAVPVLAALVAMDEILSSYRPGVSGAKPLTDTDAD
jgi:hypothetical protein